MYFSDFVFSCFQFDSYLSDIGGSLGLYFGMSLLSLVQIVELVVDLIIYFLNRGCFTCKQRLKVGPINCKRLFCCQQIQNINKIQYILIAAVLIWGPIGEKGIIVLPKVSLDCSQCIKS